MNSTATQVQQTRVASRDDLVLLARYVAVALAIVGGLEWLLGRTISRLAAAPNLEGFPRDAIEFVGRAGLYLITPTVLLSLALLLLVAVRTGAVAVRKRDRSVLGLSLFVAIYGLFALAHTFYETLLWLNVAFALLSVAAVWGVALVCLVRRTRTAFMLAGVVLTALAYTGWLYYVVQQDLVGSNANLLGSPLLFLNLGEIAAVLTPFAFFAAIAVPYGQWKHWSRWILPLVALVFFSAGNIADAMLNQGFMGVFTIWSVGLNLFLPWPLYAISGTVYLYAILTCFKGTGPRVKLANPNTGLGLLLLAYAGYALQLPFQFVLAVLSISLLSGLYSAFEQSPRGNINVRDDGETAAASPVTILS